MNVVQRSFAGGEISPSMYARTDVLKYATGLRTCRNFMVQKQGGVTNRAGTEFLTEVKASANFTRLLDFVFNSSQAYVLEFGNLYVRILLDGVYLTTGAVVAWNAATNYVIGDVASRLGVTYYCILAHLNQQPPNATYWYAMTGAAPDTIFEIPTPYTSAQLPDLHYVQSADTMTLTHQTHLPRQLQRLSANRWVLNLIPLGPRIAFPTGVGVAGGSIPHVTGYYYVVTALSAENGEESRASATVVNSNIPEEADPAIVSWTPVAGAYAYRIYRGDDDATFGFLGTSVGDFYDDFGTIEPDFTAQPPTIRTLFGNPPSTVGFFGQRLLFGNTITAPETVYTSQINRPLNFDGQTPILDDSPITFTIRGRKVNAIHHLLDLSALVILTAGAEYVAEGADGSLLPTAVNLRRLSENGSHPRFDPLIVSNLALYVQARGTIIRSLFADVIKGYDGTDMSVFASHLFKGHSIVGWAYQQIPHSIVWVIRDDGVLLGLTLIREHEVWGWHRHDTDGIIESIAVIPEGDEDVLYMVVQRNINGSAKRYIERMVSRYFPRQIDARIMDCSLSYDGKNLTAFEMGISGGVTWLTGEVVTMLANFSAYVAGDVGKTYVFYNSDDEILLRVIVSTYIANNQVVVMLANDAPLELQNVQTANWGKAVGALTGLGHLEGKEVSILGDGVVLASPNNPDLLSVTVTGGGITLPDPSVEVHVGLPYVSDFGTLDIDGGASPSIKDKKMLINKVNLIVEETRGLWAGGTDPIDDLLDTDVFSAFKIQEHESALDEGDLLTGTDEVIIDAVWTNHGRINVRQVDPLPVTILAAIPQGNIP